jgi:hypothetical protein
MDIINCDDGVDDDSGGPPPRLKCCNWLVPGCEVEDDASRKTCSMGRPRRTASSTSRLSSRLSDWVGAAILMTDDDCGSCRAAGCWRGGKLPLLTTPPPAALRLNREGWVWAASTDTAAPPDEENEDDEDAEEGGSGCWSSEGAECREEYGWEASTASLNACCRAAAICSRTGSRWDRAMPPPLPPPIPPARCGFWSIAW